MCQKNFISVESLNEALKNSNNRAIRLNKALNLDTVYLTGRNIIRENAQGNKTTIKKLAGSANKVNTIHGTLILK